jgi:hypothetical protein
MEPIMNDPRSELLVKRTVSVWKALWSLAVLGVFCGLAWRLELEMRGGWKGLRWIGYFHWAPVIGAAVFGRWLLRVVPVRSPIRFGLGMAGFGLVAFAWCGVVLAMAYGRVPSAMLGRFAGVVSAGMEWLGNLGGGSLMSERVTDFLARVSGILGLAGGTLEGFAAGLQWMGVLGAMWVLVPLGFCVLLACFGVSVRWWAAVVSGGLFVLSWPLGSLGYHVSQGGGLSGEELLDFLRFGAGDPHALKSGWVFPVLVFALGFPAAFGRVPPRFEPPATLDGARG